MYRDKTKIKNFIAGLREIEADFEQICWLNDDLFSSHSERHNASIGQHARHIIEFVQELNKGTTDNLKKNTVAYEERQRQRDLEQSTDAALTAFSNTVDDLCINLSKFGCDYQLKVKEAPGYGMDSSYQRTNLGRETLYVIEHAVHHFALIKAVAKDLGYDFDDDFGVATSTKQHRNQTKQLQPN